MFLENVSLAVALLSEGAPAEIADESQFRVDCSVESEVGGSLESLATVLAFELSFRVRQPGTFHLVVVGELVRTFEMSADVAILLGGVIVHPVVVVKAGFAVEGFITIKALPGRQFEMLGTDVFLHYFECGVVRGGGRPHWLGFVAAAGDGAAQRLQLRARQARQAVQVQVEVTHQQLNLPEVRATKLTLHLHLSFAAKDVKK